MDPLSQRPKPTRARLRRALRFFIFCLILAGFSSAAQARSWNISNFQDTVTIADDGSATVTEQITCVFAGSFQGIYRRIPIDYPNGHGGNYTLYLDVLKVTDEQGASLKYEVSNQGAYRQLKIYVPGALDATRTVDITYRVRNGIRYFDDYDEFYWNVTGNDWPVTIDHATATVQLPAQAQGTAMRVQAFTGVYGSHDQEASSALEGTTARFETTNPLPLRGGLTIDVLIPKGVLREPSALTRLGWFVGSNPIIFLPVFTFIVMFALWSVKGRDPDPGVSVAPMYEPPAGMTPAEAGAMLGDQVHPRDISATVVNLAVKGYIKIEQTSEKHLFMNSNDYVFHLLKPRSDWAQLPLHEQTMLDGIFDAGTVGEMCPLSSLRNQFYATMPAIKSGIMAELKEKGMYGLDPSAAAGYDVLGVIIIAAPFLLLQFFGIVNFALAGWLVPASLIVAAVVAVFFFRIMPAKSLSGARATVAVRGFQEFMNRVDRDRLRTMPPDTFEKFLPYAMALGVEERWAQAFAGLDQQAPGWYVGPQPMGVFNPVFFTHNMNSMATTANNVFVSAPRSSSSGSGFGGGGGGGFSGGGFGGGGGGAF